MDGFCGPLTERVGELRRRGIEHSRLVAVKLTVFAQLSRHSGRDFSESRMALRSSIRTKLYSLVPATLVGGRDRPSGSACYVQSRYGIGGPIYEQMAVQKEFLSEVSRRCWFPTLGYIAILELETETDPADIAATVEQLPRPRRPTTDARARSGCEQLPEGEARRLLERDLHRRRPRRCSALANDAVHPARRASRPQGAADQAEITRVLRERSPAASSEHQASRRTGCETVTQDTVDAEKRGRGRERPVLEQRQHRRQPPGGRVPRS